MIEIGPNLAGVLQWAVFCGSAVAIIMWGGWLVATKFEFDALPPAEEVPDEQTAVE